MDFKKIRHYVKLMKSLGISVIGLIGGEPTLHPQLFEIIRLAKHEGFTVTLYTNGRLLSNEAYAKKLKKLHLDFVNFSIQSGSNHSEEHDRVSNISGAWNETKMGIENCNKYGLVINIQTVLTHTNLEIYKEIIGEFPYANLFIFYREVPPIILGKGFFKLRVLPNKETKELYKQIHIYAEKKRVRTYFFSRMPLCWWDENDPIEKKIQDSVVAHCHIVNGTTLIIDVNGKVLPCTHYINMHTMPLEKNGGVVSKSQFLSEFNSGIPSAVRKNLTYIPDKRCLECKHYGKRCTGGCPLTEFEIGPHVPHG